MHGQRFRVCQSDADFVGNLENELMMKLPAILSWRRKELTIGYIADSA
jgi:hypothetical protein